MKKHAYDILHKMEELFPQGGTELVNWETDFQLLISIILSAQSTDAQVNKITGPLFAKFPDAVSLATADFDEVLNLVFSINYNRSKARNIIEMAQRVVEVYGGSVPQQVKELITLRGVGEKTANVFLNNFYGSNEGIGVDTHIMRVSQRLGLTRNTTPEKIAKDLQKLYAREDWSKVNNLFVLYGRYYCKARMTKSKCVFKEICSYCGEL